MSDADGRTRLADLYQRAPCRVLFPDVDAGQPPQAVMLTTSGGLTGGDRLSLQIEAKQDNEEAQHGRDLSRVLVRLLASMAERDSLVDGLTAMPNELLQLAGADGAAQRRAEYHRQSGLRQGRNRRARRRQAKHRVAGQCPDRVTQPLAMLWQVSGVQLVVHHQQGRRAELR